MADLTLPTSTAKRFGFGLTESEVERLRQILTCLEGQEVPPEEAWGRTSELLALTHALLEIAASGEDGQGSGRFDRPGELID